MADFGLPGGVNPLDFLYKLATQRALARPEFSQVGEQGPPHSKVFVWHCSFNNVVAQGQGRSKKEAKVAAAKAVRDQLNFDALPPPPTYQSVMEKKRKKGDQSKDGGSSDNGDGNGDAKRAKKYDYSRHFQCYGPGPGFGPGMASLPYGYLPGRQGFGGPPGGYFGPEMGGGDGYDPSPIDPHGYDPFSEQGGDMDQGFFNGAADGSGSFPEGCDDSVVPPMNRGFMSRLSKLDRYVIKKHSDVYPAEENLNTILKMVLDIEEAMKQVSQEWNDDNVIKIEGMVRVGDLAKGLLLATDRSVSVILLCEEVPTLDMLQKIHVQMRSRVKEVDSDYDTKLLEKEAAFAVCKTAKPVGDDCEVDTFICYVTFTSTVFRKVEKEDDQNGKEPAPEASEDVKLPKEKCLQALADLRHSRWFAAMAANLPSCVECIRIMKDLARRDPAWSPLSDWTIELLVERALYSAWRPLNPAASLMRVMEVLYLSELITGDVLNKYPLALLIRTQRRRKLLN
jgi:hypothetical protein